jgi:hypothetical protein
MFNPFEHFVVQSIRRIDIADLVNDVIQDEEYDIPPMTPEDVRLTSGRCQQFADKIASLQDDDLSEEDFVAKRTDMIKNFLTTQL